MIISALTDEIPETQENNNNNDNNKQEPVNIICRRGAKAPPYYDDYSRHFGLRLTVSYVVSDTSRFTTLCQPPIRMGGREMSVP